MQREFRAKHNFSIEGQPLYPHLKLTNEDYPRALATRIPVDDGDEYFGAFLNRTSVRILIDFFNRTFRLRSCTVVIDGTFPVPCTQFYERRCLAPCVASLCDRDSYLEMVDLARLFLRNDRELFLASITDKIERAAEGLDFETAAMLRDILQAVESFWSNTRWQIWLDDTVDSFELDFHDDVLYVFLVSQRRRRIMGERVYAFEYPGDIDGRLALKDVIDQFYRHHLPREIRVSHDFAGRTALAHKLGKRLGRKITIAVSTETNRLVASARAVDLSKVRVAMERAKNKRTWKQIAGGIQKLAGMKQHPLRIEAFDAAHISATGFAAGVSVWKEGRELEDEYEHWLSDRTSELDTLRAFIADRIIRSKPDLILVDGGKAQLRAAIDATERASMQTPVIAAVKPKAKHSSISHFLTPGDRQIAFDQDNDAHRVLARLRDGAHDLANATHRLGRDMLHFYELAAILPSLNERERQDLLKEFGSIRSVTELEPEQVEKRFGKRQAASIVRDLERFRSGKAAPPQPFIVPIRYAEAEGAADDLIPIQTR